MCVYVCLSVSVFVCMSVCVSVSLPVIYVPIYYIEKNLILCVFPIFIPSHWLDSSARYYCVESQTCIQSPNVIHMTNMF